MLLIRCPYCREDRSEEEFSCVGEAHIDRPERPGDLSDSEWGDYLYMRTNPRGPHRELWVHTAGCRRYFNVLRDTVSYEVLAVYTIGAPLPQPPAGDES